MRSLKTTIFLLIFLFTVGYQVQSFAAGFAVDAQSAAGLANSHAGETTGAHDIGDSYANPAVLADIKSTQLSASTSYIKVDIDDDNGSGKYHNTNSVASSKNDNAGVNALVTALHFATPINRDFTAGVSITIPFALETKYDPNWIGRYQAVESKIATTNINPMLAYKLNKQLSLGGGIQAQYVQARITNMVDVGTALSQPAGSADALGKAKGDNWGYGFNLGAKYKFDDQLQAGIGYRSKIKHKVSGEVELGALNKYSHFNTPFTTPEIANFGLSYNLTPQTQLLYDTSWTRWSRVKTIDIRAQDSTLSSSTKFMWRDSFRNAFGINYQTSDKLQIRAGFAFEKGASGQYRNPRVPESNKKLLSGGFGYKFNQNLSADFTYMHQFFEKTTNSLPASAITGSQIPNNSLQTTYKLKVDVVAVGMRYDF